MPRVYILTRIHAFEYQNSFLTANEVIIEIVSRCWMYTILKSTTCVNKV
jgi:hypothetical protein